MKTRFLFPHSFKLTGWILFIPSTILGLLILLFDRISSMFELEIPVFTLVNNEFLGGTHYFRVTHGNLTPSLAGVVFIIGAILVSFSKEKQEDEYIGKIRMESLVWATYINYVFLFFALIFIWGGSFLTFMSINMFTILLFFIFRFHYLLYCLKRTSNDDNHEESA